MGRYNDFSKVEVRTLLTRSERLADKRSAVPCRQKNRGLNLSATAAYDHRCRFRMVEVSEQVDGHSD